MIDENIIRNFTSNFDREASFSVMITGIKQEAKCNKDILTLETQYVDPNVFTIIKNQQNVIDDIRKATNITQVKTQLNRYDTTATSINQVLGRDLVIQSEYYFDKSNKSFSSKIIGYQNSLDSTNTFKPEVSGTIINGVAKVTSPDFPSRITFNNIRITQNKITIKIPNDIKNITLLVDNTEYSGEISNNTFTATINNIMNGTHNFKISYDKEESIISKNIEMIVTPIDKTIDITFQKQYEEIPCVYVTIDEKYSNLYSNYTTNFKGKYVCKNCGHIHNGVTPPSVCPACDSHVFDIETYNGVVLTFKNLKRRASYPNINITIIGGYYNE